MFYCPHLPLPQGEREKNLTNERDFTSTLIVAFIGHYIEVYTTGGIFASVIFYIPDHRWPLVTSLISRTRAADGKNPNGYFFG